MKHITVFIIAISACFMAFGQNITTTVVKSLGTLDYDAEVAIFMLTDPAPAGLIIGTTTIEGNSFTKACKLETLLELAQLEARKIGGNAVKIISHDTPDMMRSCHKIKANILKTDSVYVPALPDTTANPGVALLHVYRFSGMGAFINYDLYLDDSVICRVANKWKKTIPLTREGQYTLWAKTEARSEVPIDVRFGKEYYLRCEMVMGAFVGRPKLYLVDPVAGKAEFASVKNNRTASPDVVTLTSGNVVECTIVNEDENNLYVEVLRSGKKISTHIRKDQIASVKRNE